MLKFNYLKQLFNEKKLLIRILTLALTLLLSVTGTDAQPQICNLNELRLNNGPGWKYLSKITAECGLINPNNMGGHLLTLRLPFDIETRGVARQIKPGALDRFSIILVTGKTDSRTGVFQPDSIILEISNLHYSTNKANDPITQFGTGFFVIRMDISGNYRNGFRYRNGRTTSLSAWDAESVKDYLFEYWQNYFDSADFIKSSEGLDR